MECAFEISMYPLTKDYNQEVLDFIELLRVDGVLVQTNGMSTQVFGEFQLVSTTVMNAISTTYEKGVKASFVSKILNEPLEPDFKL